MADCRLLMADCKGQIAIADTSAISNRQSANCSGKPTGGRTRAPPPAEPMPSGRQVLHVEKQAAGAAPRRHLALTLFGDLAGLLAVLAADGERQRAEPVFGDFLAALGAVAVGPLLETNER